MKYISRCRAVSVIGMVCTTIWVTICLADDLNPPNSNPSSMEASLNRFLQAWDGGEDKTMRYVAAFSDLNSDGKPEAIVYLKFSRWCGSGGCNTLILQQHGSSWRVVTNTTITRPPIRVLKHISNGWHDIGVWTQGGGVQPGYESVLSFNGKTYRTQIHPTLRQLKEKPTGEDVITSATAAVPLY